MMNEPQETFTASAETEYQQILCELLGTVTAFCSANCINSKEVLLRLAADLKTKAD